MSLAENGGMEQSENVSFASESHEKTGTVKLPVWAHLICGWPLVMVAFGGAIGGGLGGAAYGVNLYIFKSRLPLVAKIPLNVFTGLVAMALWMAIAGAIRSTRR
jgi:hypothetical protein